MTTGDLTGQHSTPRRVAQPGGGAEREAGRPVLALLGLLAAVMVALFIITLGISAA